MAVENSVYDHVIFDSQVESRFAESLDNDPDVKMFFKIPSRFKIETPIGTYNPDWAVYLERNGEQKLYFVLETKGTTDLYGLSTPERQKIRCGKAHFDILTNDDSQVPSLFELSPDNRISPAGQPVIVRAHHVISLVVVIAHAHKLRVRRQAPFRFAGQHIS